MQMGKSLSVPYCFWPGNNTMPERIVTMKFQGLHLQAHSESFVELQKCSVNYHMLQEIGNCEVRSFLLLTKPTVRGFLYIRDLPYKRRFPVC